MKLWVQRHGRVLCEAGTCYGVTDVPAEPASTQQAAESIAAVLPAEVTLWSSPRTRCTTLGASLRRLRPDLGEPQRDPRLAEMHFGAWEGRRWDNIPRAELDAWTADFAHARPGAQGESVHLFMQRVASAWDDWVRSGRSALWLSHAGVARAALLIAQGKRTVSHAKDWPSEPINFGTWICIEVPSP